MHPMRSAGVDQDAQSAVQGWLLDTVLAVAVFGTLAAMISANLGSERGPHVVPYLLALTLGGLMVLRRRWPLLVLTVTVFGLFIYYAADYPVIGLSVPAVAALFSAAESRRPRWAICAAAVLIVVGYGVRLAEGQDVALLIGYELANDALLMAAAIALGISLRLRRQLRESSRRLLLATEERERAQTETAITAVRADIARELHDSLGHQGTVISMHTDVARESLPADLGTARQAMDVVQQTNSTMMAELRSTVRTLRQREPARSHVSLVSVQQSLLAQLPITVDAEVSLQGELPRHLDASAYRILQEALTNVVRHSQTEFAQLRITTTGDYLRLVVSDPGPAKAVTGDHQVGYGIAGMKERAAALGGDLAAGFEGSSFVVRAILPLPARAAATPPASYRAGGNR